MTRRARLHHVLPRHVAAIVGLLLQSPTIANAAPSVHVKPPEMAPGGKPGEIRRLIQSFGDWTLICDENLKRRTRVCNVSESFVDESGRPVFSWSLAATRGGAPVMILRAQRDGGRTPGVSFGYEGAKPVAVALDTCDGTVCLGFMPIGPALQHRLRSGIIARIEITGDRPLTIDASMKDLPQAIAALK